jgi:hypothetical protein
MGRLLGGWRRHRLRALPLPAEWEQIVERNVVFFDCLSVADRRELLGHTQVLLAEKRFEGCGGLDLTDEIRVTVAAYAAVLLLHRETDFYPRLTSILVYPTTYVVSQERYVGEGIWEEGESERAGETGLRLRAVVVAWDDVPREPEAGVLGHNVVLHEFAHQLDFEDASFDGTPLLEPGQRQAWARVMEAEYANLHRAVLAGDPTLIRPYGAKNRGEFFAVITELFFHRGRDLRDAHRALYEQLCAYYRQDPAAWSDPDRSRPAT